MSFAIRLCAGLVLSGLLAAGLTACMTPQERSGHNPKPFNTPASWENRPYGEFRN